MIIRICYLIYTYTPFISEKLGWPQKTLEVSSDSPPPLPPNCSGGDEAIEVGLNSLSDSALKIASL